MPKILSHGDVEKLPRCKFSDMGKCAHEKCPNVDLKDCVMCEYELCFESLRHEDIAGATHSLLTLMKILRELDALPKEAKP